MIKMNSKKLASGAAATVLTAGTLFGGVARGNGSDIVNLISTATIDKEHRVSSTQPIQCDGTFPIIVVHDDGAMDYWIRDGNLHVWLAKYQHDKTSQADLNAEYKFVQRECH